MAASQGLLPDGVAFFGRLGEIAYDPDEDRVQCHLCGEWFRHLGSSHLYRTHGWTLAQYRDAFQLPLRAPLCARSLSVVFRRNAEARRLEEDGFAVDPPSRKGVARPRVRPWLSLAARAPELVAELHPIRNLGLDPERVAWGANRRVWWRCGTCGHEWQAVVASRTAGRGCPRCARRRSAARASVTKRRVARDQSLAVLRPDLLELWHPALNDIDPHEITAQSAQRAWWRCPACGRDWQSSINNRAHASHAVCPRCARRRGAAAAFRSEANSD
jgi:transposase-like protein